MKNLLKPVWAKVLAAVMILLVIWLAASLYLYTQATSMVFNNSVSWAPVPQSGYTLNFVKNKSGQNISLWTFTNSSNDKWILYLHGNAGRLPNINAELVRQANVLSPAYPGYHESESGPTVNNVYETAVIAYDYLVNERKVPENKIIIFGHSMGGSPAVYLASQKNQGSKLVLVNTFSSIQSMCFRSYSILCGFAGNIFNSAENAKQVKIPVRQFAYQNDTTVPYNEGKKLYEYFTASNDKKFVTMDKYTHSYPDWEAIKPELK
jgi:uncharacterized protein